MTGDRRGLVLELRWLLQAPRERVFGALTEPAVLAAWWGPSGFTVPEIEIDLTVGGRYRFGMQPPEGHLFHLTGEFVDIRRPRLLATPSDGKNPTPRTRRRP